MIQSIYIRPLVESDAYTSYRWRNDPEVWRFTGSRPDKYISKDIELDWLKAVLKRSNEKRFAICLKDTNEYIGNVQLTNFNNYDAEFHIFIGKKSYWKGGFGTTATKLIIDYAFNELKLQCVYLTVNKEHIAAVKVYEKSGFYKLLDLDDKNIKMAIYAIDKVPKLVSIFMMAYNHEQYIKEAVEGILNQKRNFDFEIVVGEDCSKDRTSEILIEYAIRYPDLFKLVLHKSNVGAGKNQISVLNACRGQYVAMCEGDDYWTDPFKLQKQVEYLDANPGFSICFHKVKIEKHGEIVDDFITNIPSSISTQLDLLSGNFIHTVSVLFRNNITSIPKWFESAMPGDYPLWLILTNNGEKIGLINDYMAVYRMHEGGVWSLKDRTKYQQRIAVTMLNCAKYLHITNSKFIQHFMVSLADSIYYFGYSTLNRRDYLQFVFWALKHCEFSFKQVLYFFSPKFRNKIKSILVRN